MLKLNEKQKLLLPGVGKSVTIRILSTPVINKKVFAICEILINDRKDSMVEAPDRWFEITKNMYKRIIAELKNNNVQIDYELNCLENTIWTLDNENKIILRKDIMNLV